MTEVITDQEKMKQWLAAGSPGDFATWVPLAVDHAAQAAQAAQVAQPATPAKPDYYADTQKQLYDTGSGILAGNIPDYYKGIGEEGGESFENMLAMVKRDVAQGVNEDVIRRGVSRGGLATHVTAKSMADTSIAAREGERLRALKGREGLLTTGINTLSDVRTGALDLEAIESRERLTKEALDYQKFSDDRAKDAAKDQMLADIISGAIGGGGIFGEDGILGDITLPGFGAGGAVSEFLKPAATKAAEAAATAAATAATVATPATSAMVGGGGIAGGVGTTPATVEAGVPAASGVGGALTVIGVTAVAALAMYKMIQNMKGGTVNVNAPQVIQKLADDLPGQNVPKTIATMADMVTKGVWDEEKNYQEHLRNIKIVEEAFKIAGQAQISPEFDETLSQIMQKGLSWQKEQDEINTALKAQGYETADDLRAEIEELRLSGHSLWGNWSLNQYKTDEGVVPPDTMRQLEADQARFIELHKKLGLNIEEIMAAATSPG